jgi:hypothetical protein
VVLEEHEQDAFARAAITLASDVQELAQNRQEALRALVPVAGTLSDTTRAEVFRITLMFARGEHDATAIDAAFRGSTDPLSRFRVDLGPTSLRPAGLLAAAALARGEQECREVESEARQLLSGADEATTNAIARALTFLPPEDLEADLGLLATHSSASVRALAAVLWAGKLSADTDLGERLASDPLQLVRRSLANSLREDDTHDSVRAVLVNDPRRSVRQQLQQ